MAEETPTPPPPAEGTPDEGQLEVLVDESDKLREKIEAIEKEKKDLYDRLLRTAADLDNFRKRSRKEVDDARAKARDEALLAMLPGIDNLERAIAAGAQSGPDALLDGVKLVLRQFQSALERVEVRAFESVGVAFDPARHEAIAQVETDAQPAGTIVTEMQRGYTSGTRLLRPALVTVAKGKPAGE
jgi:molecular chaperone GrpE